MDKHLLYKTKQSLVCSGCFIHLCVLKKFAFKLNKKAFSHNEINLRNNEIILKKCVSFTVCFFRFLFFWHKHCFQWLFFSFLFFCNIHCTRIKLMSTVFDCCVAFCPWCFFDLSVWVFSLPMNKVKKKCFILPIF